MGEVRRGGRGSKRRPVDCKNGAKRRIDELNEDIPLYLSIERDLRRKIDSGDLQVDSQIASEEDLARAYGVSRMTLRHALTRLVAAGVLERRRGIGTFVGKPRIERDAGRLIGFAEDTSAQGMVPRTEVVEKRWVEPSPEDARVLRQGDGEQALRILRLRYASGEPLSYNFTQLTAAVGRLVEHEDFSHSLYTILGRAVQHGEMFADQRIESIGADAELSRLLDVGTKACLLKIERIIQSGQDTVLGLSRNYYRGDRYTLVQRIRR
jgi:GntR family transcriptional regulator